MRITKDWLDELTLKQQTVLLSAIRGCDNTDKNDLSKFIVRKLRSTVICNACEDDGDFMEDIVTPELLYNFSKAIDKYPVHFLLHLVHASEIIGYKHPSSDIKTWWNSFYCMMVDCFHMNIETEIQMDHRLRDGVPTVCHKT